MTTNNTGSDQGGKLLGCPTGHAFVRVNRTHTSMGERWYANCTICAWHGPLASNEAKAIAAWNTRAHPPERIRELEEEVARLRGHLSEHISFAEDRISDGKEMGFRVWRIALEDIARENRAILGKGTIA